MIEIDAGGLLVEEPVQAADRRRPTPGFELQDRHQPPLAGQLGIDPKQVPDNRYFIVFLHDQRRDFPTSEGSQFMDAAQRAKQWVQEDLAPNDYVAVVSYDYKLKLQQDFTRDRDGLTKAIDRAVKGEEGTWPSRTVMA